MIPQHSDDISAPWCLIESDPGVFNELMQGMGINGVQMEEIYSLDDETLSFLSSHIYGLIFLFKWSDTSKQPSQDFVSFEQDPSLYFAKQVINNACATQAILNLVMNIPEISLGEYLTEFKACTESFPPELKGLAIGNSDRIREEHNKFTQPAFLHIMEDELSSELSKKHLDRDLEDVFHFTCFLPRNGTLYELDGLKPGPVVIGNYDLSNPHSWLTDVAAPTLAQRMAQYSNQDIRFSLMALVKDRILELQERIDSPIAQESLAEELQRRERINRENILRKHNWIPLVLGMIQIANDDNSINK